MLCFEYIELRARSSEHVFAKPFLPATATAAPPTLYLEGFFMNHVQVFDSINEDFGLRTYEARADSRFRSYGNLHFRVQDAIGIKYLFYSFH